MAGVDRRGRTVYGPNEYVIVLQEDRAAYRVARIERLTPLGTGYMVRFWKWAHGRWSGETQVGRGQILGRMPGRAPAIESIAANLQAYANMRTARIREADEDMLAAVSRLCDVKVI